VKTIEQAEFLDPRNSISSFASQCRRKPVKSANVDDFDAKSAATARLRVSPSRGRSARPRRRFRDRDRVFIPILVVSLMVGPMAGQDRTAIASPPTATFARNVRKMSAPPSGPIDTARPPAPTRRRPQLGSGEQCHRS